MSGFEVRRGVEHLLHPGAALGAFVTDDDDIARLHFVAEDAIDGLFLRFVDPCTAAEDEQRRVDAGRLDDAAVAGDVARQHGQPAVVEIGMLQVADAACRAVCVRGVVIIPLGTRSRL